MQILYLVYTRAFFVRFHFSLLFLTKTQFLSLSFLGRLDIKILYNVISQSCAMEYN